MIWKKITSNVDADFGILIGNALYPSVSGGIRQASIENLAPEITEAIKNIDEYRNPDHIFVVVIALGAGEYWGSNSNGDYFPEIPLKAQYPTYELHGKVFKRHKNKPTDPSYGRVIRAGWNPKMHRVELLISVSRKDAPDIVQKIEQGEYPDVSMGVKAEYDKCSICGNVATTRREYCDHLKYHMNEIMEDGRKVYAINEKYTFFDISFVLKGADPTAKTLLKVAEDQTQPTTTKKAEINKQIPGKILGDVEHGVLRRRIDEDTANKLSEIDSPENILKSLSLLRIWPSEEEIITLIKSASTIWRIDTDSMMPIETFNKVAEVMKQAPFGFVKTASMNGRFAPTVLSVIQFFLSNKTLASLVLGGAIGGIASTIKSRSQDQEARRTGEVLNAASMTPEEILAYQSAKRAVNNPNLYGTYKVIK